MKYFPLGGKRDRLMEERKGAQREREGAWEMVLRGLAHWHTTKPLHASVCVVYVCARVYVCIKWIRLIKHPALMSSHFHASAKQPNVINCCVSSDLRYSILLFCVQYAVCKHTDALGWSNGTTYIYREVK